MKKLTDEEIQKLLEENISALPSTGEVENDEDLKTYHFLFKALAEKPAIALPDDFADKTVEKIRARRELISAIKFHIFIGCLIVACIAVVMATIAYIDLPRAIIIYSFFWKFKSAIIFGIFSFTIVQLLDQVLVKSRFLRI